MTGNILRTHVIFVGVLYTHTFADLQYIYINVSSEEKNKTKKIYFVQDKTRNI